MKKGKEHGSYYVGSREPRNDNKNMEAWGPFKGPCRVMEGQWLLHN